MILRILTDVSGLAPSGIVSSSLSVAQSQQGAFANSHFGAAADKATAGRLFSDSSI